jgi:hypothetical protein
MTTLRHKDDAREVAGGGPEAAADVLNRSGLMNSCRHEKSPVINTMAGLRRSCRY